MRRLAACVAKRYQYPIRATSKQAALPQAAKIVAAAKVALGRSLAGEAMAEFRMPSLGADMEAGTLVEWLVKPGDRVKRGDIIAVVETQKGAIEIEIFETGQIERISGRHRRQSAGGHSARSNSF